MTLNPFKWFKPKPVGCIAKSILIDLEDIGCVDIDIVTDWDVMAHVKTKTRDYTLYSYIRWVGDGVRVIEVELQELNSLQPLKRHEMVLIFNRICELSRIQASLKQKDVDTKDQIKLDELFPECHVDSKNA